MLSHLRRFFGPSVILPAYIEHSLFYAYPTSHNVLFSFFLFSPPASPPKAKAAPAGALLPPAVAKAVVSPEETAKKHNSTLKKKADDIDSSVGGVRRSKRAATQATSVAKTYSRITESEAKKKDNSAKDDIAYDTSLPLWMTADEESAFPVYTRAPKWRETYLSIRNAIIDLWRANRKRFLTQLDATTAIPQVSLSPAFPSSPRSATSGL